MPWEWDTPLRCGEILAYLTLENTTQVQPSFTEFFFLSFCVSGYRKQCAPTEILSPQTAAQAEKQTGLKNTIGRGQQGTHNLSGYTDGLVRGAKYSENGGK